MADPICICHESSVRENLMCPAHPPERIMDEQVASCLLCGKLRKLAVWHGPSGVGVCEPCRSRAVAGREHGGNSE